MLKDRNDHLIVSYLTLRKLIGILGMLLPFVCMLGGSVFQSLPAQDSISAYYHTNMRDVFVGLLVGVSMFLLTYKGHEKRDTLVAIASGITGLGIALFPCGCPDAPLTGIGMFRLQAGTSGYFHYGSAVIFFVLLAFNSFFLFTLGDKKNWTKSKTRRNGIYRACGLIIFASLVILGILTLALGKDGLDATVWTLVFETVMLLAFGTSWLVKGETIFKDKPDEPRFDLTAV